MRLITKLTIMILCYEWIMKLVFIIREMVIITMIFLSLLCTDYVLVMFRLYSYVYVMSSMMYYEYIMSCKHVLWTIYEYDKYTYSPLCYHYVYIIILFSVLCTGYVNFWSNSHSLWMFYVNDRFCYHKLCTDYVHFMIIWFALCAGYVILSTWLNQLCSCYGFIFMVMWPFCFM